MKASLSILDGGNWLVTTVTSTFQFDLDAGTITRLPGPTAPPTVNDQTRPILEIVHCKVGERGYWLMKPDDFEADFLEHYWHLSSIIQSIEPASATEATEAS
ncbi:MULTISPECIES: hypothetical protein [unclassified Cryobacterium]|uniref:hypothetical protein n=1 Tax=unclassified Cryobacterium TaxID=2649013 RepID=UPI002AB50468|nr:MULTISPECIES: hypothetical protein [unclassified Cryobacterium]MDY7528152.1 hypothetical protein [Cryobacterium sp. 10C2]MDY7556099.1 hypothetical protein [Cryobacterium sp. 10C3]MEB0289349.1 hypothetical protein [Cryobacterium sp. 10C2]